MIDNWDLHPQAEKKSAKIIRTYLEAAQALLAAAVGEQVREVVDQGRRGQVSHVAYLPGGGDAMAGSTAGAEPGNSHAL